MDNYKIKGMSCAACQARVEKAVKNLDGIEEVSVNLLTNSMCISGSVDSETVIKAVKDAGYGAKLVKDKNVLSNDEQDAFDSDLKVLKKRLLSSIFFLILLMYLSMGHAMFHFKIPKAFADNPAYIGITQAILSLIILIINKKFFISGFKGLIHRAPNMDTLVALGSSASFIYSVAVLIKIIQRNMDGNIDKAMHLTHDLYFESAAMILTLITVGKILESISKGRTTNALKSLMSLTPKTALVERDQKEMVIPIEDVKIKDLVIVKAGESIPVDGLIVKGFASIDESALTGESIPVDKGVNDFVSSGTVCTSGYIYCRTIKVGKDTTLSKIIQMVSDASASKAPIARIADRVSAIFVPFVMIIALITFIIWTMLGYSMSFSLARAISVLVISCPCALGLATPVAIMVGNGVAAKSGILFKNATALEEVGKIKAIALDKTGTITNGTPVVTNILTYSDTTEDEIIKYSYSIEKYSEHPLAKAICEYAKENNTSYYEISDFKTEIGNGLSANIEGNILRAGKYDFISKNCQIPSDFLEKTDMLSKEGKTPLFFSLNNSLLGAIAVADTIKEDSPKAINALNSLGIECVMLTGDNKETAANIAAKSNIQNFHAEVLPQDKESHIVKLKETHGKIAMVGDGINDAPALTRADIGIAIGAGTHIAIESADIVLVKNSLNDVSKAIILSRKTLKNIKENLFWAFIYNVIGIPLAAGLYYPIWGIKLNPMFGAAAMSLSSFCVVINALRLNLIDLKNN